METFVDTLLNFFLSFYGPATYGYAAVFIVLLLCGLGLPVPEDITLVAGGVLSYVGICDLAWMIVVSMLGVIIGDSVVFFLGAKYGRALTKKWIFRRLLPDDRLDAVGEKFKEKGEKLLFAARFMPGLRAPIFFSAGVLRVPYSHFILYDGSAALLSVPLIVGAVYYFGDELDRIVKVIKRVEHGVLFLIIAVILALFVKWYIGHRRQRQS